jgi:hypothetical protein
MVDVYFATNGTGIKRIIFHCEEANVGSRLRSNAYRSVCPVAYFFPLTADDFIRCKLRTTVHVYTQDHNMYIEMVT